jgi:uncharacterized protein YjdB
VTVEPTATTLNPAQTVQLGATTKDASGNTLNGRSVAWTSNNTSAATVDGNGLVTAVAPGAATITATSEGKTATAQITVQAAVATITVAPPATSLLTGATTPLTATLRDAANNVLTGRPIAWSTGNATVATVDANGVVTAVTAGTATITATSEGKSGTAQIAVLAPVATVSVTPGAGSLVVGQTGQLAATLRDAANNVLNGRAISWSTSNATMATVDGNGLVTAVAPGPVTITATSEGKSGSAQVTVLAPVTSVTMNGALTTKVGDSYTYTATARIADGSVVVRPITWSIVETTKGTMSPDGVLVPLQTGTITLRATIDGEPWVGTTSAYDWEDLSSGGSIRVGLRSDGTITNKFGTSERPTLLISCTASGYFFVWVSFDNFVTQNGLVSYFIDNGPILSQLWDELAPAFSSLWHPGATNVQRRAFAAILATAGRFGFAFTEFNGSAKAMLFRVTGLAPLVAPIIAACPSNSLAPSADEALRDIQALRTTAAFSALVSAESEGRARTGPLASTQPSLGALRVPKVDGQVAVRQR